jgi:hypothetical protein
VDLVVVLATGRLIKAIVVGVGGGLVVAGDVLALFEVVVPYP